MGQMIFASQSNPVYFNDAQIDVNVDIDGKSLGDQELISYFGGNTVAISPAMYAVYQ